ncbi:conserved hypothetical protein [Hyphomicrobiales bacterium]|nr:conserved hypothetical protein [Hyphomicrobiales bacterium]
MLHRYWFSFSKTESPCILNTGCGVTAFSIDDAKKILEADLFPVYGNRQTVEITEDIDISKIEDGHIIGNMKPPIFRGIWFPLL